MCKKYHRGRVVTQNQHKKQHRTLLIDLKLFTLKTISGICEKLNQFKPHPMRYHAFYQFSVMKLAKLGTFLCSYPLTYIYYLHLVRNYQGSRNRALFLQRTRRVVGRSPTFAYWRKVGYQTHTVFVQAYYAIRQ